MLEADSGGMKRVPRNDEPRFGFGREAQAIVEAETPRFRAFRKACRPRSDGPRLPDEGGSDAAGPFSENTERRRNPRALGWRCTLRRLKRVSALCPPSLSGAIIILSEIAEFVARFMA